MIKKQVDRIYREIPLDKIPWNAPTPSKILQEAIKASVTTGVKIHESGCGAGDYVIHFSRLGIDITGVDISDNAISIARDSASPVGLDWELPHRIFPEDRETYVRKKRAG